MTVTNQKTVSPVLVALAFATVYIVWGSTYFFIRIAVHSFPPFLLGALRFFTAGLTLLIWCAFKGEPLFNLKKIKYAAVSGILLLFVGNGAVIWVEQTLPSAMVAIILSAAPIWFILFDQPKWAENFSNKLTITGLAIGFAGVLLLFGEQAQKIFLSKNASSSLPGMVLLIIGSMGWAAGSLYSKYKTTKGSAVVNSAWQMVSAGLFFVPISLLKGEVTQVKWQNIPNQAWLALVYLILFGSIAAFSAYIWLLQVRPATQVSTYAYVNPVIAVLLGVFLAGEKISILQITGLAIILGSVLLINLTRYQKSDTEKHLALPKTTS